MIRIYAFKGDLLTPEFVLIFDYIQVNPYSSTQTPSPRGMYFSINQ
jgi:hypothetical protein